jgi:hypothetical protein
MRFFPLKFDAEICETVIDSRIKRWTTPHQTRSLWTKPCGDRTWSMLPYRHVRSVLVLDIMQCRVAIDSLPTFWDNLLVPSSRVMKSKRTKHNWSNWHHSLLFWDYVHHLPDHNQQHCYRHAPTVKPEAANAAVSYWRAWRRPKHVERHINVK